MTTIFVPQFWPFFTTSELRRFDYTSTQEGAPPFTSVFSYDVGSKSMLYNNYDSALTWLNKWYYDYRPGFGVAEWRDDYPKGKKVVLSPPIGWGEFVEIGSVYQNKPKFSFFKCWPPASEYGDQIVQFEQLIPEMNSYKNVLQFSYLQSWGGKAATGARYWMAENVGPIATEFLIQDDKDRTKVTTGAIYTATVSRVNG